MHRAALLAVMLSAGVANASSTSLSETVAPGLPVGVTQMPSQSILANFARRPPSPRYLEDANGMSLYTFDDDGKPGKSTCVAECEIAWPPLQAPAKAPAMPEWSVVTRKDGARQWAYRGKPLYRFVKDTKAGETNGDGAAGKWHLAVYEVPQVKAPAKIAVKSNALAGGDVMVDYRGFTLYVMRDLHATCADECLSAWTPLLAPMLAKPVGDWATSMVGDHLLWLYAGRAVYTFTGDVRPGDANGIFSAPTWHPLLVRSYPQPAEAKLARIGSVLTWTTADGRTLYARDRYQYAPGSFNADDGSTWNVITGRAIGTNACDGACPDTWKPFEVASDEQSNGYWQVVTRQDGTRQWAYQGYALYTNGMDKKPGEMLGRDMFDLQDGGHAMYWRVATP